MKTTSDPVFLAALGSALAVAAPATAAISITQSAAPAPTYQTLLTFDEPGTPSGGLVPSNYWKPGYGLTITDGVNGNNTVIDNLTGTFPWLGTGNVDVGTFGVYLAWNQDVAALSFQAWDPSGPPSPFGNGLTVLLLDASDNILEGNTYTGAWGGVGNTWFDVTTSGGDSFRKAIIFNNSFDPTSFVDNVSWNLVPGPGALCVLGLGLVGLGRRRRA